MTKIRSEADEESKTTHDGQWWAQKVSEIHLNCVRFSHSLAQRSVDESDDGLALLRTFRLCK